MKKVGKINEEYILDNINKLSCYTEEEFIKDALMYARAIKDKRMICVIPRVSSDGTSRVMRFMSAEIINRNIRFVYYNNFFRALGYKESKNRDGFIIRGCGMDMVHHTNYSIINTLYGLKILNRKEFEELSQRTPIVL